MTNLSYTQADKALEEHIHNPGLRRHCRGVAASMARLAERHGEDPERWRVVGLLHDLDWEETPEAHPHNAVAWIGELGGDEAMQRAVLSHDDETGVPRATAMDRALYACDELSGFVIATALVRPTRLDGLRVSSVKKKMESKTFAAAVDRDHLRRAAKDCGYDFDELVQIVIGALQAEAEHLFPVESAT